MDEQTTQQAPEVKEDGQKEKAQLQDLIKQYGQAILIGLGLAVVVFLGLAVYKNYQKSAGERAAQALFTATSPEQLQQVVLQYGSSPAAPLAAIMAASMAYQAGQFEMAQFNFTQFTQKYPHHLFAPAASLGVAQSLEALGQLDQALNAYDVFIAAHAKHYLLPNAILSKGRCLELMGRFDDAKTVYEDFIAAHPDTPSASQAESALLFVDMKRRAAALGVKPGAVEPAAPMIQMAPPAATPAP